MAGMQALAGSAATESPLFASLVVPALAGRNADRDDVYDDVTPSRSHSYVQQR